MSSSLAVITRRPKYKSTYLPSINWDEMKTPEAQAALARILTMTDPGFEVASVPASGLILEENGHRFKVHSYSYWIYLGKRQSFQGVRDFFKWLIA